MQEGGGHLARTMAEVAGYLESPIDLDTALKHLTAATVDTLPTADAASVSVTRDDGSIDTLASTDEWVHAADALQYELQQGPAFDAATDDGATLLIDAMVDDLRWPDYCSRALTLGIGSQIAFRLHAPEGGQIGALNAYARAAGAFADEESRYLGELLAAQVGLALGWSRQEETLREALATRGMIGQALGIVMERYGLGQHTAFGYLVRVYQDSNVKLRQVAEDIVTRADHRGT